MVTIVEGITKAVISVAEEIGTDRGGVFIETSMLATREVGLVIWDSARQPVLESLGW